ncbi:MAG: hypothetical protein ACR2OI_13445 [Acidimicrobiia bacterium]
MRKTALAAAVILVLAACGGSETPGAEPAPSSTAAALPSTGDLEAAATELCTAAGWVGIREGTGFASEAGLLDVSEDALWAAVRRQCPDTVYRPLTQAEVDWCGDGLGFGQNYFRVIAAGVEYDIESFSIVEATLVNRAANGLELSDYEVELLTAELQTMAESSRFERDWAEACRTTY